MSGGAYSPDKAAAFPDRLLQLRAHPYPVHLHLVLSDLCNLDCPGCAYRLKGYSSNELFDDGTRNPRRFLATKMVKQILDDCAQMGTKGIEFTGGGEPTLHRDLGALLRYAQELGLDTALVTNGLRMGGLYETAARCQWVRISVDAASDHTYSRVRPSLGGGDGRNLQRVLAAMEQLRKTVDAERAGCTIGAGFVVQRDNWREIHEAVRLCRDHGAHNVRVSGLFTPEGAAYHAPHFEAARELEQRAVADFDGEGFRVYGRFGEKVDDLRDGAPDYRTCHYQRLTTYVAGDGRLYRCCIQAYSRLGFLADLREHGGSLKAAWDSVAVRHALMDFDARGCVRCQFNDRNRAIARLLEQRQVHHPDAVVHPSFV